MTRLKRLIVEIHHRSLWQVLVIYVGGAWVCYEIIDTITDRLALPPWLPVLAIILFLIGLPVVLATAFVHEVAPPMAAPAEQERRTEAEAAAVQAETAAARLEARRRHRFLTWRNAVASFVVALAVWGLVAAGWVILGGTGFLLTRAAAADFVEPEDCVVVAEFENETERPALGVAARDQVVADISRSGYVTVLGHTQLRETLGLMRVPDTTRVDEALALEIGRRENCPAVVTGSVTSLGTGYSLTAAIIETDTRAEVVRPSETAADETEVIGAVERLARLVRRHLGESLPSIRRSEPLYRLTTSSLEALEYYTLGARRADRQGDQAGAIALLEQAVALDTTFAEAYRKLSAYYYNTGNSAASYRYSGLAYRFRERLTLIERLRATAQYHGVRGRVDSAAYYRRVLVERYPNERVRNNLCLNLNWMVFELELDGAF
jgi:tetratricopeptide (TPR) repeat protein